MRNNFKSKYSILKTNHVEFLSSGFTMVEIIFVIVIIGILASIGTSIFPDNRLYEYSSKVTMNLKKKQKNAIGYDIHGFNVTPWTKEDERTCMNLNETDLLGESLSLVRVDIGGGANENDKLCFDEYGRPYIHEEQRLLTEEINITINYNNNNKTILVYPYSGYVKINQ